MPAIPISKAVRSYSIKNNSAIHHKSVWLDFLSAFLKIKIEYIRVFDRI